MKNILQALVLFVLVGFSTNSHSQVTINFNSTEVVPIQLSYLAGAPYLVPSGKMLIITHISAFSNNDNYLQYLYINDESMLLFSVNDNYVNNTQIYCHIPVTELSEISSNGNYLVLYGYLINMDDFGVSTDVPDDEIIDNGGGGIEIYPNPTDDLASVFVDYPGDWNMTVYDLNGQIVLETQSETPVKSIDTNSLSAGTYIVSVRAKRKLIGSSQLIVQ
jgi:hypothetical protein